jgi:hypothetical protein
MREEAAIQLSSYSTRRENDESVSVIGSEQRGYSRGASESPGENYP